VREKKDREREERGEEGRKGRREEGKRQGQGLRSRSRVGIGMEGLIQG
jgi:hypothetical protein